MPGTVRKLMEEHAVILADAGELRTLRHGDAIRNRTIERAVAALDRELNTRALDIVLYNLFGGFVGRKLFSRRRFFCKARLDDM